MLRVDEPLPADPLHSEVVLHVRLQLRRLIRRREPSAPSALALLFGFPWVEGEERSWQKAASSPDWLQAGATVAARRRTVTDRVVPLGHDNVHVAECKQWLRARKERDDAFAPIVATDLATLLELSKARDMALAQGSDDNGERRHLPVLIQGPTGSGKELLAKAIHSIWHKTLGKEGAPFEVVHVAGMTDALINDELFGHVKGAFTDAKQDRAGRLETANGGTILIDEVGDLPPAAQLLLLRFLQTHCLSRFGENRERNLSVRVIAATWHDLDKDVAEGRFREDLLYRLRVGSGLMLRSLVEREGVFDEVVPELIRRRGHVAKPLITRSARDALAQHEWRGNLREMVGVIAAAVSLADGETLRVEHLPPHLQRTYLAQSLHARATGFLADELDGQLLTEELACWRVAQVTQSFMALPAPSANPELNQIGEFLVLLDDPSDEHQRSVGEIRALLSVDQERRRQLNLAEAWKEIAAAGLPAVVTPVVREAEKEARTRADELAAHLKRLQGGTQIEQNPWLRLFREVQSLPLLRYANPGDLAKFFFGIYNFLRLIAPSLLDTIREDARTGGFQKIRSRVVALLEEGNSRPVIDDDEDDDDEEEVGEAPRRPSSLSREDWIVLTRRHATLAEAQAETGYDPKTIAKYLSRYDIPSPWSRRE